MEQQAPTCGLHVDKERTRGAHSARIVRWRFGKSLRWACYAQCGVPCQQLRVRRHLAQASPHGRSHFAEMAMQVLCRGSKKMLCRPCVDCGLYTGRFCDHCLAASRVPSEEWAPNQATPLCSQCDWRWEACRFCRGVHSCTPPAHGQPPPDDE